MAEYWCCLMVGFTAQLKNNGFISSDLFPLVLDCHLEEPHQDGSHSLIASMKHTLTEFENIDFGKLYLLGKDFP
jgi:hypothetical protein